MTTLQVSGWVASACYDGGATKRYRNWMLGCVKRFAWKGEYGGVMQRKRSYFAASYVKSRKLLGGMLLFTLCQTLNFLQSFGSESVAVILGNAIELIWIGIPTWLLIIRKEGGCQMPRGNFYIIINLLLGGWGIVIFTVDLIALILAFAVPRLIRLFLTASVVIGPSVILWNADKNRTDPDIGLMLILGAGGLTLSVLWLIVLVLQKSRTGQLFFQMLPDVLFQAGCTALACAALSKGVRLKKAYDRMMLQSRRLY